MEPMSSELLSLLSSLLQSKENKIVPYAARLLYILMASDKFHKEANSMDIGEVLDGSIKVLIIYFWLRMKIRDQGRMKGGGGQVGPAHPRINHLLKTISSIVYWYEST